jgi:hypothetical protein
MKFPGAAGVLTVASDLDNAGLTRVLTIDAAVIFALRHFTCTNIVLALILGLFTCHSFTTETVSS